MAVPILTRARSRHPWRGSFGTLCLAALAWLAKCNYVGSKTRLLCTKVHDKPPRTIWVQGSVACSLGQNSTRARYPNVSATTRRGADHQRPTKDHDDTALPLRFQGAENCSVVAVLLACLPLLPLCFSKPHFGGWDQSCCIPHSSGSEDLLSSETHRQRLFPCAQRTSRKP